MPPSSLIFVAVVAIWAAFLVQHWVRRREAMAIARSVDRFSAAMRLLDRRPALPSPAPRPPLASIASAPLPAAHELAVTSPLVARSSRTAVSSARTPQPLARVAAGPRVRRPRGRLARRLRGLTLLVALLSVPLTILSAALGTLPWWPVGAAVAAVAVGVFTLRYAAVRERTRRRLDRSIDASIRLAGRDGSALPAPGVQAGAQAGAQADTGGPGQSAVPASRGERAAHRAGLTGPTWSPVPVPPPTYTLKERAYRPEPEPADLTPVVLLPVVVPAAEQSSAGAGVVAAVPQPTRRAVGG